MRQGVNYRKRKVKGGRKPGRKPGYFERLSLVMQDNRRHLSLKSLAKVTAGGRRSSSRSGSLLRPKKRKRSKLLRNA